VSILPKEFFVVAHRGASAYEPENTIPAIVKAVELHADAVEVDVRACRDGELVVFHDEDLRRLLNVDARVADLTLNQLKGFKVGGKAEIPTLREVIEVVRGRVKLLTEIKERGIEGRLVNVLRECGVINDTLITSFNLESILKVKELDSEAHIGLIINHPYPNVGKLRGWGVEALLPRYNIVTGRLVREVKSRGMRLIAWVVNDVTLALKLRGLGVDGIATDKPDIKKEVTKYATLY